LGRYFSKGNQTIVWFTFHMMFANLFPWLQVCHLHLNLTLCKIFTYIFVCRCPLLHRYPKFMYQYNTKKEGIWNLTQWAKNHVSNIITLKITSLLCWMLNKWRSPTIKKPIYIITICQQQLSWIFLNQQSHMFHHYVPRAKTNKQPPMH
jgi:hypothetical protein